MNEIKPENSILFESFCKDIAKIYNRQREEVFLKGLARNGAELVRHRTEDRNYRALRKRLVALQSLYELERKSLKSERKGYRKEGTYYRRTDENNDLSGRQYSIRMLIKPPALPNREQRRNREMLLKRAGCLAVAL